MVLGRCVVASLPASTLWLHETGAASDGVSLKESRRNQGVQGVAFWRMQICSLLSSALKWTLELS